MYVKSMNQAKLVEIRKTAGNFLTQPVVKLLGRTRISPNAITWLGFLLTLVAAALIGCGNLFVGGIIVLVAGFFDIVDGAVARSTNQISRFGAILDSTLDRLSEAALLLGILVIFAWGQSVTGVFLVGLALVGSIMVSYLRARVEVLGIECKVGLFTRSERVIVLALGLLLSRFNYALMIALVIIVSFSFFTVGERLVYAWRQTKRDQLKNI